MSAAARVFVGRVLIGLVLLSNLLCAVLFMGKPEAYTPAFELEGVIGAATLRGIGLLFLMWNVPYMVALFDPIRYRISLWEAIFMQALGFVGESLIQLSLPAQHTAAHQSLIRFIVFDGLGLLFLLLAAWITRLDRSKNSIQ